MEIKNCICGNIPEVKELFTNKNKRIYFVMCKSCGIRTRNRKLREDAIKEWNMFYGAKYDKWTKGIRDFYGAK